MERLKEEVDRATRLGLKFFAESDYDTWVSLMTEDGRHPRVVDIVTEDNFAKFVEARKAGKSGNIEMASELRAELGLNNGKGLRDGSGFGGAKGMKRGLMQGSGKGCRHN